MIDGTDGVRLMFDALQVLPQEKAPVEEPPEPETETETGDLVGRCAAAPSNAASLWFLLLGAFVLLRGRRS